MKKLLLSIFLPVLTLCGSNPDVRALSDVLTSLEGHLPEVHIQALNSVTEKIEAVTQTLAEKTAKHLKRMEKVKTNLKELAQLADKTTDLVGLDDQKNQLINKITSRIGRISQDTAQEQTEIKSLIKTVSTELKDIHSLSQDSSVSDIKKMIKLVNLLISLKLKYKALKEQKENVISILIVVQKEVQSLGIELDKDKIKSLIHSLPKIKKLIGSNLSKGLMKKVVALMKNEDVQAIIKKVLSRLLQVAHQLAGTVAQAVSNAIG